MPKKSSIPTYVTLLFLQTMFIAVFILPIFGYRTYCRMYPSFEIFRTESGIHIYSTYEDSETIDALYNDPTLIDTAYITLYPLNKVGPFEGIIELYQRQSLLSSPDDYRWRLFDMNLSQLELETLHQDLIYLAQNDPWLTQFNPGAPEQLSFLPMHTLLSLIKVTSYFGFPALLAWLMGYTKTHTQDAIAQTRQSAGLCIHCAYDCQGLPGTICPECGKNCTTRNPLIYK